MKFKTNQLTHPHLQQQQDTHPTSRPEEMSSVLNDSNNSLRAFIENLRNIVGSEDEEESQGVIVLFGIDEETGHLSLGIARHQARRTESNLERYRERIGEAASIYEREQLSLLNQYSTTIKEVAKRKAIYAHWTHQAQESHILRLLNAQIQNLIDYPRMNKQRSPSNDTVESLSGEAREVPEDQESNAFLDQSESLMEVE